MSHHQIPIQEHQKANRWVTIHHETEKNYWWFVLKRQLITHFTQSFKPPGSIVLEIGCGGGRLSWEIQQRGYIVLSTDYEPSAVQFAKELGINHCFISNCGEGIPIADESIDLIVMTDVLEHIQNHTLTINECFRILKRGGFVIITVPAYPYLFSSWDRWNNHYRRYKKNQLVELAKHAQFEVKKLTYWNMPGLPFAVFRKIKDLYNPLRNYEGFPPVPPWIEMPLKWIVSLENKWVRRFSLPMGLSLIGIFKKPE